MDKTDIEHRAARMAGDLKATVGDLADDARTRVEDLASQAAATADQAYGQVRNQVRGAATAASATVEKQPLAAMMIFGLITGVMGFLLARR